MSRKVLTNSLIGASIFIGATGIIVGVVALKKTHTNDSKYLNLNNTFKEMHELYGGSSDAPEVTSANIDDLNKKIADNFEYLANKIDSSKEGMVEYFNNDLHTKMEKILNDFKNDLNQETDRKLSNLSDDISVLTQDYRSLEERLIDTQETIASIKKDTLDKLKNLQTTSNELKTKIYNVNGLASLNRTNIAAIDTEVGRLTVKIIELNTKQSKMNTLIQRNKSRIAFLKKIIKKVKASTKKNTYDIKDLETRVTALETEQTKMSDELKKVNLAIDLSVHQIDLISETVEDFKEDIRKNGKVTSTNSQKLSNLKTNITALQTQVTKNITTVNNFLTTINTFKTNVETLMSTNAQLQKDINYLSTQNHKLFDEMLKMQSAIKEINQNVIKGSTMIVLNPKDENNGDMVIYDSESSAHISWWTESLQLKYPLINIPLLEKAKNISVILKMQDPSGVVKNFEVKAIDTFPTRGINLINGFDTPGRTSFLMDMEISDNDLVINHLWYRKYARHWQDIKKLDNFKVILSKIQIIY